MSFKEFIKAVEEFLKYSFIIGGLTALIVYIMTLAVNKRRKGVYGYSTTMMIILVLSGGFFSYLVGTFIDSSVTILGISISRDFILGVVGASSFSLHQFLEKEGQSLIGKIIDKILRKF